MKAGLIGFTLFLGSVACSSAPAPTASTDAAKSGVPVNGSPNDPPATDATPATSTTPGLPAGWGAEACVAPKGEVGFAIGESLGELGIKDCDTGASATIDEVCGASATWIFAAHTHCPTCQATAGFTDDVATAVANKNVAVVQLVYDDNGTTCAEWRDNYKLAGITNVRVYADPGGKAFAKLKISNYTAASAFIDEDRVITYKEHGLSKAKVLAQIEAALAE